MTKLPDYAPWKPVPYTLKDIAALKAVANGSAEPSQQQHAMKFIVEVVGGRHQMSYSPANQRDTDFAEGRRFCGNQIAKLVNLSREDMEKVKQYERSTRPDTSARRDPEREPAAEQPPDARSDQRPGARQPAVVKKRRGRPPGSKNKPKPAAGGNAPAPA